MEFMASWGTLRFARDSFTRRRVGSSFMFVEVFALCVLIVVCLTICLWILSVYHGSIGLSGIIFMEFENSSILSHS